VKVEGKPDVHVGLCFDFAPSPRIPQMLKFSAYGFLKNQTYFVPFLLLFFRFKGLTYAQYGLLMTWNEVVVNILEIPAGALSDTSGRRRTLLVSFSLYMICFLGLTFVESFALVFFFFSFFSGGEAFRGGTHKAMIFEWLRLNGRKDLKVQVYGYTRMWSKLGNALASVVGGALVVATGGYKWIFIFSLVPYVLNSLNMLSYPAELDGGSNKKEGASVCGAFKGTCATLSRALREFKNPAVCGFCLEAFFFEGPFRVVKDYLQPLLQLVALRYTSEQFDATRATGSLAGAVYLVLFLLASAASVNAHVVVKLCGTEQRTAVLIWLVCIVTYLVLMASYVTGSTVIATTCFIVLYCIQSVWRPLLMSRLSNNSDDTLAATVLSVEAQSVSFGKALCAPLIGYMVDKTTETWGVEGTVVFWAVPAVGIATGLVGWICCVCLSSRAAVVSQSNLSGKKTQPLLG